MKKRKDGRYRKVFTDPITHKKVYIYGDTEREVNRKIFEYKDRADNGLKFQAVSDEWWAEEVVILSPSTVRGYEKATARVNEHFGDFYIRDIKTQDISRFFLFLKRQGFAKKTVKNHKIIINRIFHFATVQGYVDVNVSREAELPRGLTETKRHPATPRDEKTIKGAAEVWLLPFMALLTGMRKGELLGLQYGDIDMTKRLIYVRRSVWHDGNTPVVKEPKTEAGKRRIPILNLLYDELLKLNIEKQRNDYFVFGGKSPMTDKAYRCAWARFQKATGITCTAHQLRKSYATLAVAAAVPPDVLKSIFGHADISTTLNIYAEVRDERITDAAGLLNTATTEDDE